MFATPGILGVVELFRATLIEPDGIEESAGEKGPLNQAINPERANVNTRLNPMRGTRLKADIAAHAILRPQTILKS